MAEINTTSAIDEVRGKFKKADKGYFYIRNGKQFYRDREENYQKNQSPKHQQLCVRRQKWPQRMTFYFVCGRHLFSFLQLYSVFIRSMVVYACVFFC